jgi:hypothetical protein
MVCYPVNIPYGEKTFFDIKERIEQQKKLADILIKNDKTQIHVYTNMTYDESRFSELFHILFQPSIRLQKQIDANIEKIGEDYVSITFRFQQLLADFVEGDFPVLNYKEREQLINICLDTVFQVKERHKEINRILVTTDSNYFLNRVKEIDYVYVIPGDMQHMDFTYNKNDNVYIKSFVDFYLLSRAKKIYFAYGKRTYTSSRFAQTASLIHNVPYETVEI